MPETLPVICRACQRPFLPVTRRRVYCSLACYRQRGGAHRWVHIICPVCGHTARKRSWLGEAKPIYCSRSCYITACVGQAAFRKYHFTEEMTVALKFACREGKGGLKRLWRQDARFRDIPYPTVRRHAARLGVLRTGQDDEWQPDELDFAIRRLERGAALDSLAASMRQHGWHRTPSAIRRMQETHHVRRHLDFFTLTQVADAFGVDWRVVKGYVQRGELSVHHTNDAGTRHYISYAALKTFVERYPAQVAQGKPDIVWLIGLLTGPSAGYAAVSPVAADMALDEV